MSHIVARVTRSMPFLCYGKCTIIMVREIGCERLRIGVHKLRLLTSFETGRRLRIRYAVGDAKTGRFRSMIRTKRWCLNNTVEAVVSLSVVPLDFLSDSGLLSDSIWAWTLAPFTRRNTPVNRRLLMLAYSVVASTLHALRVTYVLLRLVPPTLLLTEYMTNYGSYSYITAITNLTMSLFVCRYPLLAVRYS